MTGDRRFFVTLPLVMVSLTVTLVAGFLLAGCGEEVLPTTTTVVLPVEKSCGQ